jgi:hypothetical protein
MDMIQCSKFLSKIKRVWLLNPDNPVKYKKGKFSEYTYYEFIYEELCEFMVMYLYNRYKSMLEEKNVRLDYIEDLVKNQPIDTVYFRMLDFIEIWSRTYSGPPPSLEKISMNSQSVHMVVVTRKTNDGISLLESQTVPRDQKTLGEIKATWLRMYKERDVDDVIKDMTEWGSRPTVMNLHKNIYKCILRGLWARIKTFEGDLKSELVRRLWEECSEAVGLCADGHVGRLVNVLIGFDEQFKAEINPKESFQNNMALIANSDNSIESKIDQANTLMDEIQMPLEERQVWLDAF